MLKGAKEAAMESCHWVGKFSQQLVEIHAFVSGRKNAPTEPTKIHHYREFQSESSYFVVILVGTHPATQKRRRSRRRMKEVPRCPRRIDSCGFGTHGDFCSHFPQMALGGCVMAVQNCEIFNDDQPLDQCVPQRADDIQRLACFRTESHWNSWLQPHPHSLVLSETLPWKGKIQMEVNPLGAWWQWKRKTKVSNDLSSPLASAVKSMSSAVSYGNAVRWSDPSLPRTPQGQIKGAGFKGVVSLY